jgi:diguanylate cyclase (GGDEF)-like protein
MSFGIGYNSDFNEREYRSHISQEIIFVTRLVSALGMVMFLSFYVADFWAFSSSHDSLLFVRITVTVVLGLTLLSTYSSAFFEKYSKFILPVPYLAASTGINYMIYLASPTDYASQVYFVGLMLIMMMMFGWSFLKLSISLAISLFILSLYSYVAVVDGISNEKTLMSELFINLAFLISSAIIGFISQLIRDRHLRENFLLQQSLKEAYKAKSAEAKDNKYLANHDALTDLPNRRYMMELLEESMQIAKEKDKVLVIMFLDLNGFKQINDIYGHAAGDEVLIIVAKRLELAVRRGDHLSRLGGDEYLVGLMMEKENLDEVEGMTKKFIDLVSQPMNVEGLRLKVGTSVGVAAYPIHGNNIDVLLDIADKRMYQVKRGRHKSKPIVEESKDKSNKEPVVIFPGNSKKSKQSIYE